MASGRNWLQAQRTHTGSMELSTSPQKPKSLLRLTPCPGIRAEKSEAALARREAREQPLGMSTPEGEGGLQAESALGSDFQDLQLSPRYC